MGRQPVKVMSLVVVVALALAAACSSGDGETGEGAADQEPGLSSADAGDGADESGEHGTGPDAADAVGGAEYEGDEPGPEDGEVEVERFVSPDESGLVLVACVQERGYPAGLTRGGGVSLGDVPDELAAEATRVMEECSQRFPLDPRWGEPLDEDGQSRLYHWLVDEAVPCIEGLGIEVPDVPTEEGYRAAFEDDRPWSPFQGVGYRRGSREAFEDWAEFIAACPTHPPVEYLYGDD